MFPSVGFGTQITKEQELAYLDKIIKISNFICSEIEYYKNRLKLIETSFILPSQLDILIEYLNAIKTNAYIIAAYSNLLNNYRCIIQPINWIVFHYYDKYHYNVYKDESQHFLGSVDINDILKNISLYLANIKKCQENDFARDKEIIYNSFDIDVEKYLTQN